MSSKSLVSRVSPKPQRHLKGRGKTTRQAKGRIITLTRGGLIRKLVAKARATGTPVMINLRELASAYPGENIPMLVADNIQVSNRRISTGLVIDAKALSGILSGVDYRPRETQQVHLLSNEDMVKLDQVIDLLGTAGRSTVHAMETSNRIFGVLPPGRIRGKRYPRWQFDRAIAGDPLRRILAKLESVDAWGKYQFFTSAYPELGHLTPIEVLTGHVGQAEAITDETRALIRAPHEQRVSLVVELAEEFAHPS